MWKLTVTLAGMAINQPADLTLPDTKYDTLALCMNAASAYAIKLEKAAGKDASGSLDAKCQREPSVLMMQGPVGTWQFSK